jgi:hypothetical protein
MTSHLGCVAAAALAAAIMTATPATAAKGVCSGTWKRGSGLSHHCACRCHRALLRHHRHFHQVVFAVEPYFYDYGPYYYNGYGNYCWQQAWTPRGWRWLDICYGFAF